MNRGGTPERLDTFVDAAFAFAITLLVADSAAGALDLVSALRATIANLPAFSIGFLLLAMFWHEHVAWRRLGGNNMPTATLLSLALVFAVLVFVLALVPMADALSAYVLTGTRRALTIDEVAILFRAYGGGFALMCSLTMLLFLQGRRHGDGQHARQLTGRAIIYGLLATAGAASMLLTFLPRSASFAPWVYLLLPPAVGLFAWRYRWEAP